MGSKIEQIKKRDGRVVSFDQQKITAAVSRAMRAAKEGDLEKDPSRVSDKVVKRLEKRFPSNHVPNVEQVQDTVEEILILMDFPKTAKSYILYRRERADVREKQERVPERIKKLVQESRKYFQSSLGEFIYFRTYSRWVEEEGRRETWIESVDRYIDFMKERLGNKLKEEEYEEVREYILNFRTMPSMRLLWSSGKAARATNVCAYNCSYVAPSELFDFAEIMYLLMCGCGVGFSVENQNVQQLPIIKHQTGETLSTHVVKDSKEGWGDALTLGLKTWYEGKDIEFDCSEIRPAGARLKTMGGRSSGPEPFEALISFVRKKVLSNQGRRLKSIDVHDIICRIGKLVQMGGVRRSALISLSDLEDEEMRDAKTGHYYVTDPQRSIANNSAVYGKKPEDTQFMEEWLALAKSGSGERGIFNRGGLKEQLPERRWKDFKKHYQTSGTNPCVTGDTLVYTADGRGSVPIRKLTEKGKDVPVFCLSKRGGVTVRYMRNPRLTGRNQPVYRLTLEDGSTVKTTADHKFRLKSGEYREVQDLKPGDSLDILTKYEASIKDIFPGANSRSQDYWWVNKGLVNNVSEHRLIAEFHYNAKIPRNYVVHHRDGNAQNNNSRNLEVMAKEKHDELHNKLMLGDNNPMRRARYEWNEEKWNAYILKHSNNNREDKNRNFSGFTNEVLRSHALKLTKSLGYRFSNQDWVSYAQKNGLPQTFSKWRKDHLGGVLGLAKWAAQDLGFEHIDANPRVARSYKKLTSEGYDCEIIDGGLFIVKRCEVCGRKFRVKPSRREHGVCSISCALKEKWQDKVFKTKFVNKLNEVHSERKKKIRKDQIKVYSDLKFKLGRAPFKEEWFDACKKSKVSPEISRQSSPFRYYSELKESADMYNHKVVSVEFAGYENVYNGTVDEFHNFFVGGFESETRAGKRKLVYLNNLQCGEIILRSKSFCNLTEVVARPEDTEETLLEKVRIAAILGTYQASLTDFPYISKEWKKNCEEERLLGVSITGQWDCPAVRHPETFRKLYEKALEVNKEYAKRFGINESAAVTSVKPSGTVSQLVNAAAGMHPRYAPFYVRRVRISANDPLFHMLKERKVPYHPEVGETETSTSIFVLDFPVRSPKKSVFGDDLDAIEQLEYWKMVKENYTEHNPSVTILVEDNEWLKVANWLYENWGILGGLTFLPRDKHIYELAPFEELSEEDYKELVSRFPEVDYSQILAYEKEDRTTGPDGCESKTCEIS